MKRFLSSMIAVLAFALAGCSQIDTGNVGVESTLGQVKSETLPPGVYFTAFKTVTEVCAKELPISLRDMKPQTSDKITLDDLDVDIYVQINPAKAAAVATKWAGDRVDIKGDCTALGQNYITRQAREAVYDATTKFGSATIHTERAALATNTVRALQAALDAEAGKGMFTVVSANVTNLDTDKALQANIKAAANAQFEKQKEANLLEVTKLQAERQREQARGEADAIRIKAEAVAKQGGAEYVQLQAISKWDGKLPVTQAGGAVPFLNVGK